MSLSFCGFAVPADHEVKIKESEMIDKYLDLARELKKLWDIRVTEVPIVIDALGTVPKKKDWRNRKLEKESRLS